MDQLNQIGLAFGGVVYALLFAALMWRRPAWGLLLIFSIAPFQHDLSLGGPMRFSLAEINLWLAVPILFMRRRTLKLGPLTIPVWLYLGIGGASSLLNWTGAMSDEAMVGIVAYVQTFQYWVVAVALFAMMPRRPDREYRLAWIGLLIVGVFLATMLIITRSSYVIGLHKNGIGASLACAFIVAVELWFSARTPTARWMTAIVTGIVSAGLILCMSRGAWLGSLAGVLLITTLRRQFRVLLGMALLLSPLVVITWNSLPEEARATASSVDKDRENIRLRYESIAMATEWFKESPVYGLGVGLRKRYDATNVIMLKLAETGVLGLGAFLFMHLVFFGMIWHTQRYLPRTDPLFSALTIGGALVLYKFVHGCVDHYWSRGALMCACGGAGMALRVYFEVRQRRLLARRTPNPQPQSPMVASPAPELVPAS